MTDKELLRQFVQDRSQQAFTDLVRRHIDVVYSAARRQTRGDAQLAEEVTQQTFILLAQKAASLKDDVLLGGWLFNTVRFIARDVVRKDDRRALHEQKAAQMAQENTPPKSTAHDQWKDAEAVLDETMADLDEPTRGLLVLRFFEGKTSREVGERLGISEEAARKRISRAVDELRELFGRRGVAMSPAVLGEALLANAVIHAPEGLAASAATAATAATTATASTVSVKSGVAALLLAGKAKVVAAVVAGAVVVVGGAQAVKHFAPAPQAETIKVPTAAQLTGIIRDASGKPVQGAEILVGTQQKLVNIYDRPRRVRNSTDAEGKFSVPKPSEKFTLIARCPSGVAQVSGATREKSTDITLQPWGKIEGVLLEGSKPVANAQVRLWAPSNSNDDFSEMIYHQTDVRTDASGKFTFPAVAPGEMWLSDLGPVSRRTQRQHYVIVEPGKTVQVTFGGGGRAVVGKLVAPSTQPVWTNGPRFMYDSVIRQMPIGGRSSQPNHVAGETPEEYRAKEIAYGATLQGRTFKTWWIGWNFEVNVDGTFRIHDVPPGKYYLSARNLELLKEVNYLEDWARKHLEFTVPEGASEAPVDLGELEMDTITYLKPGNACPPFEFTTLDGKTHNITDFRGKHVLMIAWYSQGDQEEMRRLKATHEKWKNDPRLVFVWLSIDRGPDAKAAAEKHGITGIVAATPGQEVPREYGASATSALLIGPEGKLVQKHLIRENVDKYLGKALGKPQ